MLSFCWYCRTYATCCGYLPPANEVWGKVIFSQVCVKNSVHGGVYLGRYPPHQVHPPGPGTPPWASTPPRPGTSPDQVHPPGPGTPPRPGSPPEQCMLGDTGNKRAVRILLECILVFFCVRHLNMETNRFRDINLVNQGMIIGFRVAIIIKPLRSVYKKSRMGKLGRKVLKVKISQKHPWCR